MTKTLTALALSAAIAAPALLFSAPASAREGISIGGGVKCYWVAVSTSGGTTTLQQVCRKGI